MRDRWEESVRRREGERERARVGVSVRLMVIDRA